MRFSIVTPSYNMGPWIAQTMDSILLQEGDFDIEYIIVDSGSTDDTDSILRKYEEEISNGAYPIACRGVSLKITRAERNGMYAAINRGLAEATGDVCAWINADDLYAPHTFANIARVFAAFPETRWLKGITDTIDESGNLIRVGNAHMYRQDWIACGIYGRDAYYIEQDSVFWRRGLWEMSGPIPEKFKYAGDYWLWKEFAKHSPLTTVDEHVSFFRKREGQLSKSYHAYRAERDTISPRTLATLPIRLFFSARAWTTKIFPKAGMLFVRLYPLLFVHEREMYVAIENEVPVKKQWSSFAV